MQAIGRITVFPVLPERVARLRDLADNLYWSWNSHVQGLFEFIEPSVYAAHAGNPARTLLAVSQADLDRAAASREFLERYDAAVERFDDYVNGGSWFSKTHANAKGTIAYFCMEYGFHESLQIYSGGLGVLAGDHCKSASDLGLPFVAVGLLFRQGYFHQWLNRDGWQEESYEVIDPVAMGMTEATGADGKPIRVSVELPDRSVFARVWRLNVGRVPVYLLDADCEENRPEDRTLTARLYGGGHDTRVPQELILGVGGLRALRALGIEPTAFHMNEGHAAFLGLERCRELVSSQGLSFGEALEATAGSGIFTTHTPVSAGNDAFSHDLVDRMLVPYWCNALKIGRDEFLALARQDQPWGHHGALVPTYSMTVLALRVSRYHNGVSELHGEVSRKMWNFLWPGAEAGEVPITHITNGIHTRTFLAPRLGDLYDRYLAANWDERIEDPAVWAGVDRIPDSELWETRQGLKHKLIRFVRERLRRQALRHGAPAAEVAATDSVLSENALTVGFARRFATYKRATLLFRDLERLRRIVGNAERPVQFIFAGKAHPQDNPGKEFIQAIYRYSRDAGLSGKVVMLEDYDMNVARHLVQGCDIWLNNPRRPLEASGTSGEKAGLNGGLNFSVLDGWWRESFDGRNGWAIGEEREYPDLATQDDADTWSLYETLEDEIVPLYFAVGENGQRTGWLERVRHAIKTVAPRFSMQRQVQDYSNLLYAPAMARGARLAEEAFEPARRLATWKASVRSSWPGLRLEGRLEPSENVRPGGTVPVSARVYLAGLEPTDLRVEAVVGREGGAEAEGRFPLALASTSDGWAEFRGTATLPEAGAYEVGLRALPYREELAYPLELGLMRWA